MLKAPTELAIKKEHMEFRLLPWEYFDQYQEVSAKCK